MENPLFRTVQQGFRITVGAATVLIETIQDPEKRVETWSDLQTQLSQRTQEWAEKGVQTEQEARQFVENWINRSASPGDTASTTASTTPPSPVPDLETEVQTLTEQLTALRKELEELRKSEEI